MSVAYQPLSDPNANNWNLLNAIPGSPPYNLGDTPAMIVSKVLNGLFNEGSSGEVTFAAIQGSPNDNTALAAILATYLVAKNNLSDVPSKILARANLGLGTAAVLNVPMSGNASGNQVVIATDTRLTDSRTPSAGSIVGTTGQVTVVEAANVFTLSLPSALTGIASIVSLNGVSISLFNSVLTNATNGIILDWLNCVINDSASNRSIDFGGRVLYLNDGLTRSLDWENAYLIDPNAINSVSWGTRFLVDSSTNGSLDWDNRLLVANDGTTTVLNWSTTADAITSILALGFASLASPAFTGVPTAPTAAPGTNTTQLATTAFVAAAGAPPAYLGKITGCNLNSTVPTDNACAISAAKYILRKIVITNASVSLAALNPVMAIYDAAGGTGDLLANIPAAAFNLLTVATKFIQFIGNELVIMLNSAFSLAEFCSENTLSTSTLYARLTTAAGSAATADVYFYGDTL